MKKILFSLISISSVALLGGCVSLEEYDRVVKHLENEQAAVAATSAENARVNGELGKARNENKSLRSQIEEMKLVDKGSVIDEGELYAKIAEMWGGKQGDGFEWIKNGGAVGVRMDDSGVLFKSGSWELTEGTKSTLKKLAGMMKDKLSSSAGVVVRIDGHTDSDPLKSLLNKGIKDNVHLSTMRAMAVREFLSGKECGLPIDRIFVAGFGEYWPVEPGKDTKSKQRNRRVEIYMGTPDSLSIGKLPVGAQVGK